jgi:hypothetical protein
MASRLSRAALRHALCITQVQDRLCMPFSSADDLGARVLQAIHNCEQEMRGHFAPNHTGVVWLLFPFVTNQAGFDTGISISNVSSDPVGTPRSSGSCTLTFYGVNAPAPLNTSPVGSGEVFTVTLMNIAPNFQGYMVAECRFSPARGFAFISDIGAKHIATGYLAEVLHASGRRG